VHDELAQGHAELGGDVLLQPGELARERAALEDRSREASSHPSPSDGDSMTTRLI
jgi:hypothetical protein